MKREGADVCLSTQHWLCLSWVTIVPTAASALAGTMKVPDVSGTKDSN